MVIVIQDLKSKDMKNDPTMHTVTWQLLPFIMLRRDGCEQNVVKEVNAYSENKSDGQGRRPDSEYYVGIRLGSSVPIE